MFILFIEYEDFNDNFNYLYKLFYTLDFKIKLINNINIQDYILNNHKEENKYIFYEIFDIDLFTFIQIKYNKNIYYFINDYKHSNNLNEKYKKINYILISNKKSFMSNFNHTKLILDLEIDKNNQNVENQNVENQNVENQNVENQNVEKLKNIGSIFSKEIEEIEKIKNEDFGFIILRHVNNEETSKLWIKSVYNIRKYYRNKIYIIDDNSNQKILNKQIEKNKIYDNLENVFIIQSEFQQRGEILPYYYLYKNKLFHQCLIIHDSTFINKYIDFEKYNEDIYYLWHFEHEANDLNNEKIMINHLNNELIEQSYDAKEWYGCFGIQTIIKYNFIEELHKKYNIFNLLIYIDNRTKRMNFERIFSVLCTLLKKDLYSQKSIYGNIKKYIKWEYKFEEYLKDEKNLDLDFVKTWNGR